MMSTSCSCTLRRNTSSITAMTVVCRRRRGSNAPKLRKISSIPNWKPSLLESFQFLSTSLKELVSLLIKSGKDNFVHIIFAKGVYPYSYVDSCEKFAETQLPSISEFHDKLKNEPLSEEDYLRAQDTWRCFGCETLKDYHDHYLLTDVLLADVYKKLSKDRAKTHGLEPLHFITLPSFA